MYSVFFLILLTIINSGDSEFVKCIAQCIELKDCEEAQLIFKEKGVKPQICGFNGTEPKVCCSENDEKTLFTFHYGGLRKAQKKCKEINPPKIFRRKDDVSYNILRPAYFGYPVKSGFRFMAVLGYGNIETPEYRCGGFLIENNVVITAAHCAEINGEPPSLVLIGRYDLTSNETKPIKVLKVIPHPNYEIETYRNDIAIIILAEKSYEFPACLFTNHLHLRHDNRTIAAGFGTTSFGGPFSKELIKVYMNIIDKKSCEKEYNTFSIAESQLCVLGEVRTFKNGTSGVQDTCQGDSGGPLVLNRNEYFVVGIVSNGRPCGSETPGIYTYVAPYTDWINSVILEEGQHKLTECTDKIPYRTLSTCFADGATGKSCNNVAYIGDIPFSRPEFGFMVELGYGDIKNPEYKCDGFFIDFNVVIKAAQCAKIDGEPPLVVRSQYYKNYVTETQIIKVVKVIPHPNYQSQTYLNDIAIVFLAENSYKLAEEYYSCLFTYSLDLNYSYKAIAFSHGTVSIDGSLSNDLFVLPMTVVNESVCEEKYKSKPLVDSQLCVLYDTDYVGEDTYQGNPGGPIVLKRYFNTSTSIVNVNYKEVKEPFYVIGIISNGQGQGVYTNISLYLNWIESVVWPKGTEEERIYVV